MVINTRKFIEATDAGLIVDSMPKEIYFDNKESRKGRVNKKWFEEFHNNLLKLFKDSFIVVATSTEDPDFILGYAIFEGAELDFVYVKEGYRGQGIGTMLVTHQPYESVSEKYMTKLGAQILYQQTHKEELLAKQDEPTTTLDHILSTAIPIIKASFQSAILSSFNAAENQLSTISSNKMRKADKLWLTPHFVIIEQNGHRKAIPNANVIDTDID